MSNWQQWNERLTPIWAEVFSGHVYLDADENGLPVLFDGVLTLPLSPSAWGFCTAEEDAERLTSALENVVQGKAPDYWHEAHDPIVQSLGWLDKRVGHRTMEKWEEAVGNPRSSLEQALRSMRIRAEANAGSLA